jgi:CBS domain-containing protein
MLISDVLRNKDRNVISVVPTDTALTALKKLAEYRIGAVIVRDKWGKLVGIFSERDMVNAIAKQGQDVVRLEVAQLMTTPVVTCSPAERIDAALAAMTRRKIRHLPVVDNGEIVGIVSIGDLVKHRLDEKELEAAVLLEISRMRAE